MALIKCKECGKDISTAAPACPQCGAPAMVAKPPARPSKIMGCGCVFFILIIIILITSMIENCGNARKKDQIAQQQKATQVAQSEAALGPMTPEHQQIFNVFKSSFGIESDKVIEVQSIPSIQPTEASSLAIKFDSEPVLTKDSEKFQILYNTIQFGKQLRAAGLNRNVNIRILPMLMFSNQYGERSQDWAARINLSQEILERAQFENMLPEQLERLLLQYDSAMWHPTFR